MVSVDVQHHVYLLTPPPPRLSLVTSTVAHPSSLSTPLPVISTTAPPTPTPQLLASLVTAASTSLQHLQLWLQANNIKVKFHRHTKVFSEGKINARRLFGSPKIFPPFCSRRLCISFVQHALARTKQQQQRQKSMTYDMLAKYLLRPVLEQAWNCWSHFYWVLTQIYIYISYTVATNKF